MFFMPTKVRMIGVAAAMLEIIQTSVECEEIAWTAATIGEGIWHPAKQLRAPSLTRYLVDHIADQRTPALAIAYKLIGYSPCRAFHENLICKEDMQ
jgi:hypothetical protein